MTHYSLLITQYSRHSTLFSLLTTQSALLTTHYSLLTTHHSPLTTHYSLLTAHCSLFTAHCSLRFPSIRRSGSHLLLAMPQAWALLRLQALQATASQRYGMPLGSQFRWRTIVRRAPQFRRVTRLSLCSMSRGARCSLEPLGSGPFSQAGVSAG